MKEIIEKYNVADWDIEKIRKKLNEILDYYQNIKSLKIDAKSLEVTYLDLTEDAKKLNPSRR